MPGNWPVLFGKGPTEKARATGTSPAAYFARWGGLGKQASREAGTAPRFVPNEYLERQLAQEEIAFEALDNGLIRCAAPARAQAICDGLGAEQIDARMRTWLGRLPQPFTAKDREAGYRYAVSILQAEFSLTQVLDRPLTGRVFFEEVIREQLDLGRPDQVQLIFDRRITRRTPGRFRTRVLTAGVSPSLHVDYKPSRIKQYAKDGRALRTETTINDTRDSGIGKRLTNLPAPRAVGLGEVGIVLALEVSRLARNSAEWYRLLELAALAGTLIADDTTVHEPRLFNDRLLLGLRGTISEVELHCIQERLQGARLSKARRGELPLRLPAGYVSGRDGAAE